MYKPYFFICALLLSQLFVYANDYDKAWEALRKNDRKQASEYLAKALKDPLTATDAYITSVYLKEFEGGTINSQFRDMVMGKVKDVNPYLFAMWFKDVALGQYGKKTVPTQLELLHHIWERTDVNGSIKAASRYVMATHWLYSNQHSKAKPEWAKMGSLNNWQLVGPFENLSGSGFYKSYGPLEQPGPTADFKSTSNAMIQWFTPVNISQEGWVFLYAHIPNQTAISYAQTFVYVPQDIKAVVNAGVNGSIKVWVNDELLISESKERVTELDCYKNYVQLKKGYNRVLVQVGCTNSAMANFIVRFTDTEGNPLEGVVCKSDAQPYPKQGGDKSGTEIKHFAEAYFEEKIRLSPDNLVNYILLSQVYLRNQKTFEARKLIQSALKKSPTNSLLRFELIQCLLKDGSRTLLSQEIELMKETDPECYFVYKLNLDRLENEEKHDEAWELFEQMASRFPEDRDILSDRIDLLFARDKTDEAIKVIQQAYKKYPDDLSFLGMMYNLEKKVYKNREKAVAVYEAYLKNNFNYQVCKELGQEYIDLGKKEKGLKIWNEIVQMFPYDASIMSEMVKYYYQQQDYTKALEYCDRALKLAPYVASYWETKAVVQEQTGDNEGAIANYRKALYFDAKRYDSRKKIRTLEKKTDLYKKFPETDLYGLIRENQSEPAPESFDFSYLLDEKLAIVYSEGAVEEYMTMVIKVHNEKGIDYWKESYIPYNSNTQGLLIEKAEIVKKSGGKSQAEQSGNELVFTSLEAGDALIIKYRLQDYSYGRLGKEFWDRYTFNAFNPSGVIRYCLLLDKKVSPEFKVANSDLKPDVKDLDDFRLYTWEVKNPEPTRDEPYMPTLTDVGTTLHISTIRTWDDVARWYSDISYARTDDEFELKDVYDEIFSGTGKLPDMEKAKLIYQYIQKNIRYSSVSFRQSAYVPQKAAVTINTRLGDCKDLSSLFVSLATMAGLQTNLVLVDTKDNGLHEMLLPSVEFNHCIALLKTGGKEYYLELTDNNLPFGSMPNNLIGASSLVIPRQGDTNAAYKLMALPVNNKSRDMIRRTINIKVNENDLDINSEILRTGALTSHTRGEYRNLSGDKLREYMEEAVSGAFKNPVKVEKVSFKGLDELIDSTHCNYTFNINDEVVEVGEMKMFKIPFVDVVATIDNFSKDKREFPLEYWRYENVDEYETTVNITIPAGMKLVEIPKDESISFNKSRYSLQYKTNAPGKITVIRKASLVRENVSPQDYAAFKEFMKKIVKAEARYIAFK